MSKHILSKGARRASMVVVALSLSLAGLSAPAAGHPEEGGDHDPAAGETGSYTGRASTANVHALGHAPHLATFNDPPATRHVNSDIAFWGQYAIHGNYDGFRVVDISAPGGPREIAHPRCNGDQGDIVVYEDIVVRSWNSPAPAGRSCMGQPVPVGFEGVHVFDISDPEAPQLVGAVEFSEVGPSRGGADGCGSHTVTAVPDPENDRLIVYSNNSSGPATRLLCNAMNVISVPLSDPAGAAHIGYVPLAAPTNGCHDAGVVLGDVDLLACASGHAAHVFSLGGPRGGTVTEPRLLYTIEESDGAGNRVGTGGRWHSAAFSWDGKVLALGWEPGGGAAPECQSSDPAIKKSMFFYDTATGRKLGQWTLPRAQDGAGENCTIHNYNIVPVRSGRYIAVGGHYQAGTWVVDFTDPANATTVAYSDPDPITPAQLGGAWSSYWYNGMVYESEIQRGLNVFRVSDRALAGAVRLPHLNPQTSDPALLARGSQR